MTSAYLSIAFLKQTPFSEKQFTIFLSYLQQEPLKEYLSDGNIYRGRRNMSKHDLIDMIITGKYKKVRYTQENDELTRKEARLKKIEKLQYKDLKIVLIEKNYKKIRYLLIRLNQTHGLNLLIIKTFNITFY